MKVSNPHWKQALNGRIAEDIGREIDVFEVELELKRQGKLEDRVIAETRLRRGVYGQRYDNGQRHDGVQVQQIVYPAGGLTKGPNTLWDAPGMQRIKVPFGGLSPEQLETMADLAEEYSDGIAHVTTRQDFQLHFVHVDDTPALMRRLAAVDITTREACGNSVRNVTTCAYAGVCGGEPFDVTPYARALARFLLGHPDCQDFGRKFKPAFSGCKGEACGLVNMHDLGLVAATRIEGGLVSHGFEVYVGGGLGAVPNQAKLYDAFLPPEELLPTAQALARVFARLGEKKNRNRARLKFLVNDLGIDKLRELVQQERASLPHDPRWKSYLDEAFTHAEAALKDAGPAETPPGTEVYRRWTKTNVRPQRQAGFAVVTIALPLGDITPNQLRDLADIARRYTRGTIRSTVEQNLVVRWVSTRDLPAVHEDLVAAGLGADGAGTILDIVSCPGTDTCKLGISSSRGLAAELRHTLAETAYTMDAAVSRLHIKVSGCFNSCGQHHVADLGFYGVSRKLAGHLVPHFQVVLGGQWDQNGGAYGLPILAIPSKRVPEAVRRITARYVADRRGDETFQDFVRRIGKLQVKALLDDLTAAPTGNDRSIFEDWGDARQYSIGDIGVGECAGEVVSLVEFGLSAAEREVFEAQLALEAGRSSDAGHKALDAMVTAAASLLRTELALVPAERDRIVSEFRTRFYDTQKFFDRFAGGKFAHYLFAAHAKASDPANGHHSDESAQHLVGEAQLFVDAAHGYYNRLGA